MEKLKSRAGLVHSLKHAYREQKTLNADPKSLNQNQMYKSCDVKQAMAEYDKRLEESGITKVRKNGVHAVEFMISASPELMSKMSKADQHKYFQDAYHFLADKHGSENILAAVLHKDETTPHLSAYVIPLTKENKLSCKSFYGERNALSDLQTDFHRDVAKKFGLERGIEKSGAKHKNIQKYYAELGMEQSRKIVEPKLLETKAKYKDRLLKENSNYMFKHRNAEREIKIKDQQIKRLNIDNKHLRKQTKDLGIDKLNTQNLDILKDKAKILLEKQNKEYSQKLTLDRSRKVSKSRSKNIEK